MFAPSVGRAQCKVFVLCNKQKRQVAGQGLADGVLEYTKKCTSLVGGKLRPGNAGAGGEVFKLVAVVAFRGY